MRVALFYHSVVSDWNNGHAHFLRGVVTELVSRGNDVIVYTPQEAWSVQNLLRDHGPQPVEEFRRRYPLVRDRTYSPDRLDLDFMLEDVDLAIVHEWNDPQLVQRIGEHRARTRRFRLLFHDTHHRAATAKESVAQYDLRHYDGVLAFGEVIRRIYLDEGWTQRAWVWHEAADTRVFRPFPEEEKTADVVWVGNWGDDERTGELEEFLFGPVRSLSLRCNVYGVRYPEEALAKLSAAGISYRGWTANFHVPEIFARHRVTIHVPRRPYVQSLRGIPTIRPFEAMACGIPLICAPWFDDEDLFTPGRDYLVAGEGEKMTRSLRELLCDQAMARELAQHALQTINARHTCAHRVDELMNICAELGIGARTAAAHIQQGNAGNETYVEHRLLRL